MQIIKVSDRAIRTIEEETIKEKVTEHSLSDLKRRKNELTANIVSLQKQIEGINSLIKSCGDLGVTDEGLNIKI